MKLFPLHLVTVLLAAQVRVESGDDDTKLIQGTWEIVSTTKSGKRVKDWVGSRWTFKDDVLMCDSLNVPRGFLKSIPCRFRLDSTTTPKSIDWIVNSVEVSNSVVVSNSMVYSLGPDTLEICIERKLDSRPTAVQSSVGDDRSLYELIRIPEKKLSKKNGEPIAD